MFTSNFQYFNLVHRIMVYRVFTDKYIYRKVYPKWEVHLISGQIVTNNTMSNKIQYPLNGVLSLFNSQPDQKYIMTNSIPLNRMIK